MLLLLYIIVVPVVRSADISKTFSARGTGLAKPSMCEVTKRNFEDIFSHIERDIHSSSFIAFDGEFTCLTAGNSENPSLFDTPEIRYGKLRKTVSKAILCQVGISIFAPDPEKQNSYLVKSHNFYLFPRAFGPADTRFLCQSSCIDFLCQHKFDYNKFMYDGIPYLNKDQERNLREMHSKGNILQHCSSSSLRILEEDCTRSILDAVYEWRLKAKTGDTKILPLNFEAIGQYMVLADFRQRFSDLTYQFTGSGELEITKQEEDCSSDLIQNCFNQGIERIIQSQIGFSRVIRAISDSKKPVIGHNCLTDLLFIFDKFYKNLPDTYKEFKSQLHQLFPNIYDTKYMSMLLRKKERAAAIFNETKLEDLHSMLSSQQGMFYVLHSPTIRHASGFEHYANSQHPHEAGYDAYLAGYVFIRMAHFIAAKDTSSENTRPLKPQEHLAAVKDFQNCVNIARAAARYVNIGGNDPTIMLPARFVVTPKGKGNKFLSAVEIAHNFLPFGSVDVQLEHSRRAVVAVSHRQRAKDVIQAFKYHKSYKVVPYHNGLQSHKLFLRWAAGLSVAVVAVGTAGYFLIWRRS